MANTFRTNTFSPKTRSDATLRALIWGAGLSWLVTTGAVGAATLPGQPAWGTMSISPLSMKATLPSQKAKKAKQGKGTQKMKTDGGATPVQYAPSGEAMPARERRLLRECKGRPNAGACLGYAS